MNSEKNLEFTGTSDKPDYLVYESQEQLREKECSLRELETATNTGYLPIKRHCEELAFLKIIELIHHTKSDANGRPYITAKITNLGRGL